MRFFTKECQEALQNNASPAGFDIIKNKEYSDAEIEELYQKRLNEFISNDEEFYNEEPILDFDFYELNDLTLEDVVIVEIDEEGEETFRHPETKKEWQEYVEASYQENLIAFNEREEFIPEASKEFFEAQYQMDLEDADYFPEWVYESMDGRLIALNYLTQDIYNDLEKLSETANEYIESVIEAADIAYEQEDIPEDILDLVDLHDANLEGIEEIDGDILLTVKPEHYDEDDDAEVLVFENARFIENEEANTDFDEEFMGRTPTFFLYSEVYNTDEGFEFHFLLSDYSSEEPLKYLTIYADDIYVE